MGRTLLRQASQIQPSKTFDDSLAAGSSLESGSTDIESDLNALRSQLSRILNATGTRNWYEDIPEVGGVKRSLEQLSTDLNSIEGKKSLYRVQVLTDVTVTAAQNWEVLNVASSESPTQTAAVGAGTASGAVVAALAGDVGSHSLNEVAGLNALNPKNLVIVRDATTGDAILSGGKQVYGLIQCENGVVDGDTFNDTDKQVQISFVIENTTADDLIACPVVDIAGKSINYSYVRRLDFESIPEDAYLSGVFTDQTAAVDVTLSNAVANQSGDVNQGAKSINWDVPEGQTFIFRDDDVAINMLKIAPAALGAAEVESNVKYFDVNISSGGNFSVEVASGSSLVYDATGLAVGDSATIGLDSDNYITLTGAATGSPAVLATVEALGLEDGYQFGSTYGTPLVLSDSSAEWSAFETAFGEVSLLNAIVQAANSAATLDSVVDAQTGPVTQTDRNIDWRVTDTYTWKLQTSDGGRDLFSVAPTAGGDTVAITCDTLDFNNQAAADFNKGITVDSADTGINLGVTAGQIDRAGALTVTTTGAGNDLTISAADQVIFSDGFFDGSTYDTPFVLSDSSAEWDAFETAFGEVSLLNAITAAAGKTTLDQAVDNQIALATAVTQVDDLSWRITDSKALNFQTSDGGVNLLSILPAVAGDEIELNVSVLDVNNSSTADFNKGITVDSADTGINLGVTAGQIDRAGALTVAVTGAGNDLTLSASDQVILSDGYKAGSTFSAAFALSSASADWSDYETQVGGELSLLSGIAAVSKNAAVSKTVAVVTSATITANTDLDYAGGAGNIDAALPSFVGLTFVSQIDIYLNGQLMRGGADASANHDVYPGTTPGSGHIKFEFDLKQGDVVTMIRRGTPSA